MDVLQQYDVILDASDNAATRYMLSDAAVLLDRCVVSGAALRGEGQLTTYHYKGGPCYRCIFPAPPPAATVTNCSDGGVLGPIVGIIGSMQALEAIKIITGIGASYSQKLLMFDGILGAIRTVKLRGRQPSCAVCGDHPTVTSLIDYEAFCGTRACDYTTTLHILQPHERLSGSQLKDQLDKGAKCVLVDTRPAVQFGICSLPGSINIEFSRLEQEASIRHIESLVTPDATIVMVCRRGNDSQLAVQRLKQQASLRDIRIVDLAGGLTQWAKDVDPLFPMY